MGTIERRQRNREQMHDAIVDAAVELFLSEGYDQTSMRKIADKIEYTPGAIYSYFKDKDEILYEIHLRGFQRLFEALNPALTGDDPLGKLHEIGRLYIKFALENPEYYDLMFIDRAMAKTIELQQHWETGKQAFDVLRQIISECIEQGDLPEGDLDAASYTFWSMVHGLVSLVLRGRCMVNKEEQPQMLQAAYDYLWLTIRKGE
jgi:AcrR family transcriptional regulator